MRQSDSSPSAFSYFVTPFSFSSFSCWTQLAVVTSLAFPASIDFLSWCFSGCCHSCLPAHLQHWHLCLLAHLLHTTSVPPLFPMPSLKTQWLLLLTCPAAVPFWLLLLIITFCRVAKQLKRVAERRIGYNFMVLDCLFPNANNFLEQGVTTKQVPLCQWVRSTTAFSSVVVSAFWNSMHEEVRKDPPWNNSGRHF